MSKITSRFTWFVALLASTSAARANILANGDFELQPFWGAGLAGDAGFTLVSGAQIPGWTIEAGHGVTVHNTALYPTISGNYSINLDGEGYGAVNADLYQDFPSQTCGTYALTFDWKGWYVTAQPRMDITITDLVTGEEVAHVNFGSDQRLHHEVVGFTGTGHELRLRIRENPESGVNDNAFILDNVSVELLPRGNPDINADGHVDAMDLAILLGQWGGCGGDLNQDGTTNARDLAVLLGAWTG
ncbi:MAG: DUF642 domain-containing protein [Phycisphaerales bacterium]